MKSRVLCSVLLSVFSVLLGVARGEDNERKGKPTGGSSFPGDYRSAASGNWSSPMTWQRFDGTNWSVPADAPDSGAGAITVRSGHTVTINLPVVYDQLVVEAGGQVTVASGVTHTLADGPGVDLTIEGTWLNQGGTWSIANSARWSVAPGGTFIQNTSAGISTPLSKAMLDKQSNFIYRGGSILVPSSSFSGRTYGNLTLESSNGTWSCTASGGSPLNVCGTLTIGAGVKWSTGGFSGAITIDGTTTIQGEWSGSGSGNLGAHTFTGDFVVSPVGKYQIATTGANQGTIFFRGNVISDGVFSLPENRLVVMNGSQSQVLGGVSSSTLSFWNLRVENSCGVSALRSVCVHDSLTVIAGNVTTGQNVLTLEPGSFLVELGSASVLGIVEAKRGMETGRNEAFGNASVEIRPLSGVHDSVLVRRTTGSAPIIPGARTIQRYFEMLTSDQVMDADMVFHYSVAELNGTRESNLELFQSTDGGVLWSDVGGIINTTDHTIRLSGKCRASRYSIAEKLRPPTVSRICPSSGFQGASWQIVLSGTGFDAGGNDARFSGAGIAIQSLSVDSPSQMTLAVLIAKDAALGERDLLVATSGGSVLICNAFEITKQPNPCPRVTSISPHLGIRGKTMSVVLEGVGLVGDVSAVSMGEGITVNSVQSGESGLRLNILVGLNAKLGPRDITVTNPPPGGGTSVLDSSFTVLNPVPIITAVSPNVGTCAQRITLVIVGLDFAAENTAVSFGNGIIVDSLRTSSVSELNVQISIAPTAASGLRDLSVVNPEPGGGRATLVGGFRVKIPDPKIAEITPCVGERGGVLSVLVTGSDFLSGATTLSLGEGIYVDSVAVLSPNRLRGYVRIFCGAPPGARNAVVVNPGPGGGSTTLPDAFEVINPPPTIVSVSPQTCIRGKSVDMELRGSGFIDHFTTLDFGPGVSVSGIICDSSGERLRARLTLSASVAPGARGVSITNAAPGGGTVSLQNALMIMNPVPTISGIVPCACGRGRTALVKISGANFITGVTTLSLSPGIAVDTCIVADSTNITAIVSVATDAVVGARGVRVLNSEPGGGSAILPHVFNVANLRPEITRISPSSVHAPDQVVVIIEGAHFFPEETHVSFGSGVTVDSMTVADSSHLKAFVSVREDVLPGSRTVSVWNVPPGGGLDSLVRGFVVAPSLVNGVQESGSSAPEQYILANPHPNPFNPSTTIRFGLPERSIVNLVIYNLLGCAVERLVDEEKPKGYYLFRWNPDRFPTGMYFLRIIAVSTESTRKYVATKRMILLK